MKKIKKKKKKIKLVFLLFLIFFVSLVGFIFLFGSISGKGKYSNKILGEWTTDGVTVYKFNDDDTGEMVLPLGKYKFDYEMKKDTLFIDFENEKSEDIKYNYSFEDGKLVLKGSNGKFIFKKK